ncbi:hypothetical protein [Hankyongella ginsenosidimutans]|uniref:hypothetical protein n=1 Tax=Hankyongella ginsenosidimutans TaxID=1763828 RepID=UPI001CA33757|nr:hypothetical protein [Hankyongella ginsenosidimutans]
MKGVSMQRGGGVFIAIGAIGGAAVGVAFGQSTIGILTGVALGIGAAILIGIRR